MPVDIAFAHTFEELAKRPIQEGYRGESIPIGLLYRPADLYILVRTTI